MGERKMSERTLPQLFEDSVKNYPNNILMWEKKTDKYEGTTYLEMQKLVHEFAAGLISLGIKKGDRIALISEGRNDWVMSELGILFAGAVNVPISVKVDEFSDLKFRLAHSECKMVVVSVNHVGKLNRIKTDLADLAKIVLLDMALEYEEEESPAARVVGL